MYNIKKKEREFEKIISQKYFRHSRFTISSEKKFYSHSCESKYHIVSTLIRIMAQTSVLLSAELNLFEAWSIDIYISGPIKGQWSSGTSKAGDEEGRFDCHVIAGGCLGRLFALQEWRIVTETLDGHASFYLMGFLCLTHRPRSLSFLLVSSSPLLDCRASTELNAGHTYPLVDRSSSLFLGGGNLSMPERAIIPFVKPGKLEI